MPTTTKPKTVVLNGIVGLEPVTPEAFNKAVEDGSALRKQLIAEHGDSSVASAWVDKTTVPVEIRRGLSAKQKLIMRRYGAALAFLKAMNASVS